MACVHVPRFDISVSEKSLTKGISLAVQALGYERADLCLPSIFKTLKPPEKVSLSSSGVASLFGLSNCYTAVGA